MRNYVSFQHPAEFMPLPEEGILSVQGSQWFVALLERVPGLQLHDLPCQEDWGVVIFARYERRRFWIGLSQWLEEENAWLVHLHHGSFAWFQRFDVPRKNALRNLATGIHQVLIEDPAVKNIVWHEKKELM